MTELRRLHQAIVGEEQIDHLGHMNVRFYLEKAMHATRALAGQHGLTDASCRNLGAVLELRGAFTRHYREQLVGDELAVMGGVLDVRSDGVRFYHELVNPARDEIAATFVHELALRARSTRKPLPLPEIFARNAGEALVDWPEHGRPRSVDLEQAPPEISLQTAIERGLATRRPRALPPEECDEDGFFIASNFQDLVWGGEPLEARPDGIYTYELEGGGRFGWATMENRGIIREVPRAGARIQSFGAEVALAAKTSIRHQWVFDVESGALLCTSSIVNLAFDIGGRRAIEIPAAIRRDLESRYHPDLR
jgi:acyl-CoA thioester hydrolase